MKFRGKRLGLLMIVALALATCIPGLAFAQIGGGLGGGGLGGGGLGGGGGGGLGGFGGGGTIGGGGGGNFFQQGAGVVVDANGVLSMRSWRDPNAAMHRQKFEAARAAMDPKLSKPSPLRKISLNRLEASIREKLDNNQEPTEEMKYLAGMLRVQYVFFYPETNDIVIAGPAEGFAQDLSGRARGLTTGRSVLELQDLIVALRAFRPGGNPTQVVGCSIDPREDGLQRLQAFLSQIAGRVTPGDANRIALGMKQALGLQDVSIEGVAANTHFAQVLVEADYRMKLIGIGLEESPAKIKSYVSRANSRDVARNAMLRWYFTPHYETVRVNEDETALELVGWGVKLVGADEVVRGDGVRVEGARADLASKAFCDEFTKMYPLLADRSPVYAQLRNLIDMTVAAAFIQQQDFYGRSGWDLGVFADESRLPVEVYETPKTVETAVNVIWRGNTLMTPIGGGVTILPLRCLEPSNLIPDEKQEVQEARAKVQLQDLPAGQWWWD